MAISEEQKARQSVYKYIKNAYTSETSQGIVFLTVKKNLFYNVSVEIETSDLFAKILLVNDNSEERVVIEEAFRKSNSSNILNIYKKEDSNNIYYYCHETQEDGTAITLPLFLDDTETNVSCLFRYHLGASNVGDISLSTQTPISSEYRRTINFVYGQENEIEILKMKNLKELPADKEYGQLITATTEEIEENGTTTRRDGVPFTLPIYTKKYSYEDVGNRGHSGTLLLGESKESGILFENDAISFIFFNHTDDNGFGEETNSGEVE